MKNKVVVVTGGAGTIGQSFVQAISDSGGIAIVADINLEAAKVFTQGFAGRAEAAYLDIINKQSVLSLISDLMKKYGHIDALVNNAYPRNLNYGKNLEEVNFIDFCENVNMHLGGYFLSAQQFCLAFRVQGYGNIVNMSSIYGSLPPRFDIYKDVPFTMPVEYAAIKAAIENLTRYFAQYYKGANIRINSLSPGGILVNQPKKFLNAYNSKCSTKGMLSPSDLVGSLVFLLSDESKYITGQNLIIDDGFSL